jgi:hypothetical protein
MRRMMLFGADAAKAVHTKGGLLSVSPSFYADVSELFFILLSSLSDKSIVASRLIVPSKHTLVPVRWYEMALVTQ